MTAGPAQFDYLDGQLRDSHPALFERFAAASAAAVEACAPTLDIPYGPHPRQTFDLFRAEGQARATIAYFHGGYWQSRDKADFRFLAPPLVADGFDVALVNYPLCPEVSVAGIVEAAMALPEALPKGAPIVLVGHSAGGQIAIELAMVAREREWDVAGVLAISGVFDLVPLVGTSLNARLGLDEVAARAASQPHRVRPGSPPAIFAAGADETAAFQRQTEQMLGAWLGAGNEGGLAMVPGADHFSILADIGDEKDVLRRILRELRNGEFNAFSKTVTVFGTSTKRRPRSGVSVMLSKSAHPQGL